MVLNNGTTYLRNAGEGDVPLWNGTYAATVVNNNDPLGVGRLQLNVPQVLGNSVSSWAVPSGSYYQIPGIGTTVSCVFLGGDPAQPAWNGPLDLSPLVEAAAPPTITYSTTAPPNPRVGDVWYDTIGGIQVAPQVWTYNSVTATFSWVVQASLGNGGIAAGAVQGSSGTGIISIAAGTITANDIKANSLTGTVIGTLGMCLNVNPFFSGGSAAGWNANGTGSSLSIVAASTLTGAPFPGYAATFTVTAGGGGNKLQAPADKFGVTVGSMYLVSAWLFSAAGVSVQAGLEFRNAAGALVTGGTVGTTWALTANTWTFVYAICTAPALSVTGNLVFIPQAAATVSVQAAQAFPQVPGIVDATTITGAQFIATGTKGQILAYTGTPAAGNLNFSVSGAAGNDGLGNSFLAGAETFYYGSPTWNDGYVLLNGGQLLLTTLSGAGGTNPQGWIFANNPISRGTSGEVDLLLFQNNNPSGVFSIGSGVGISGKLSVGGLISGQVGPVAGLGGGSGTTGGQYQQVGQINLSAQFQDIHAVLQVNGYTGGATAASEATVHWRVKQQAAMGSAPFIELYTVSNNVIVPSNLIAVIITNSVSATTVQLWLQAPQNFENYGVFLIGQDGNGTLTFPAPGTFQAALPAGTQQAGVYSTGIWQTIGYSAGFGAGIPGARYRLDAIGGGIVYLDGVVNTTAATAANATMFTLPTGYRPTANKRFAGVSSSSGYVASANGTSLIQITAAGVVTCVNACSASGQVIVLDGMSFPVD